ncbi:hypothetical protein [Arthrobacter sp. H14]|uniref:hypothetical protein n=1 Tax=Arthrobacter sp. H14 TaxID=1312959 RepID=UPI000688AFD3|nr:hypothetical protein [Arthrobacter sp. H14]
MAKRSRAKYRGTIDSITVPPAAAAPSFSAVVLEHSAAGNADAAQAEVPPGPSSRRKPSGQRIRLIWIGQRQIAGISAGTDLEFEGMVSLVDGIPTIYNPRYEINCRQERT